MLQRILRVRPKNKGMFQHAAILLIASAMTLGAHAVAHQGSKLRAKTKTSQPVASEYLVKITPSALNSVRTFSETGLKYEQITDQWFKVEATGQKSLMSLQKLKSNPDIEYIQPNYKIKLYENYQIQDSLRKAALQKFIANNPSMMSDKKVPADNPPIPTIPAPTSGNDPLFTKQWGMIDTGVKDAWKVTKGSPDIIVAVIDTGVDYTHEDLVPNLWINAKEIPNNNIDDDLNGYVDDVIGWDFVSNDNKPFDLAVEPVQLLMGGGNPGHGTHCAGNVAARSDNGKGIAGVAPNVKIMPLRFISEKGEGTTEAAIKAIKYAVDNGARVLSNSWGSEGDDPADADNNRALKEMIQYAQDHGVLFVAAAGNGHEGKGYDNDTDPKPGYPASYDHENIISVAALDNKDQLGSFSNWGAKTVDIGAPGVVVFSTTVGSNYSDTVIDMYGIKATWDGTSMATPHVAGAAALYWSAHPEKSWQEVKAALLGSVKKINSLANKTTSGGKLDVKALMGFN